MPDINMDRYRLYRGKLHPHGDGEWLRHRDVSDELTRLADEVERLRTLLAAEAEGE